MTIQIDAIYEHGTFRLNGPVMLEEGTCVVLTVETQAQLQPSGHLVAALADITAMPAQSADDDFSGTDHDEILYGSQVR